LGARAVRLQSVAANHDADAVYLPVTSRVGQSLSSTGSSDAWSRMAYSIGIGAAVGMTRLPTALALLAYNCRPHITGGHCALFLTLRTLRI
jgi:hypothetical protein